MAYVVTNLVGATSPAVAEALEVLGTASHLGTIGGPLCGDAVAMERGWTPLGLGPEEGYRHFIHAARSAMADCRPSEMLATAVVEKVTR